MMKRVSLLITVPVNPRPVAPMEGLIGGPRYTRLRAEADEFRRGLGGRCIWNINSTATGGGVAEMLQALVGYVCDLDVPVRWTVIGGDPDFFAITKRLHNRIHGTAGDGGPLGAAEAEHYAGVLAANAGELFVEWGFSIKKRSPFPYTVVSELTNDWVGYEPTARSLVHRRNELLAFLRSALLVDGVAVAPASPPAPRGGVEAPGSSGPAQADRDTRPPSRAPSACRAAISAG